MPIYEVNVNGRIYEVNAPSMTVAIREARRFSGGSSAPLPEAATRGMMPPSTPETTTETPYETPYERERRVTNEAMAFAPMVGGMIGGAVGGWPGAAILGGAGEGVRQLSSGESLDPVDIATTGAIQGGAEALGAGVSKVATAGARAVYRGYLKPSLANANIRQARNIVNTAIEEGLPISEAGVRKGRQDIIAVLKQEVESILAQTKGKPIDVRQVADHVRAFARRAYNKPGADPADYNAVLAVADRIDQHPSLMRPGPQVPQTQTSPILGPQGQPLTTTTMVPGPPVAQRRISATAGNEMKRALGETPTGNAGFDVKTAATRTGEKVGYGAARRALEQAAPAIAPLNAREKRLIDATRAIFHAVEREGNQQALIGTKSIFAGMMGGAELARSGDPVGAATTALAARIGLHPAVASRAAITAYRLASTLGVSASLAARLAVTVASETEEEAQ